MTVKVTSFLARLIEAIENARVYESNKWRNSKYFDALESCLEEAQELLHFELTRAPIQQESQPKVSRDVGQRRVTRQTTAKLLKRKISLPDEVLNVIFSYFKDTSHHPNYLSSNAYNFSLVCKSWHRVANQRLWQNVHLSDRNSTILFARSLYERQQLSPTRGKDSIDESIRGLNVHYDAGIYFPPSFTYVFDCVKLFTKNIVSLNLNGLSTERRHMKITEFYEILKFHPYLKHVWLCQVSLDSVEPLDPLPQFETFDCGFWWGQEVESLNLISAKTIAIAETNVFEKYAVKSVFCDRLPLFQRQVQEYKQLSHLYLHYRDGDDDQENALELVDGFSRIVQMPLLSFLVLDELTYLTSSSFDLIAEHCSLTTFVITWQPSEESVDSWISCIDKMGPRLLSVGVGLDVDEYLDHPNIFQAIYQNCPNLMTLELYYDDAPSDSWPLQIYASELEKLCRLPLKWIYAPWFEDWPQKWKDSCPKFSRLCRLGINIGLQDLTCGVSHLLDYNQPMRPAIVGDGFCL